MGILSRLENRSRLTTGSSLANPDGWLTDAMGGSETIAGVRVDEEAAMTFPPFWAGTVSIAESISTMPLKLYRRIEPRGREEATDRYESQLVSQSPNDEMTAVSWRQTMIIHALVWGKHYSRLLFDGGGRISEIKPLLPDTVQTKRTSDDERRLFYSYTDPERGGSPEIIWPDEMIHVVGPSLNGIQGLRPVGLAKEALGAGMAASYFGAAFFGNGSWFGGFLEHPAKLGDKAEKRLRESIEASHRGVQKAMKLKILEEGMKFHEAGVNPDNAQLVESNEFHVEAAARINRIPPHRIGELRRATFSNIEHQGIDYVVHTLLPWLVRVEQELNRKLLTKEQRRTYYFQHRVEGLLRGDLKTRYDAYAIGRQWGWLSADDVRELEDQNPLPNGQGQTYMVPLNMISAEDFLNPQEAAPPADGSNADQTNSARRVEILSLRYQRAFLPLFHRELQRVVTGETNALQRDLGKAAGVVEFLRATFSFFEKHREFAAQVVEPAARALVEALVGDLSQEDLASRAEILAGETSRQIADDHVRASRARLEELVLGDGTAGDIRAELDAWIQKRAGEEAPAAAARVAGAAIELALGKRKEKAA